MNITTTLYVTNRQEWRDWLKQHYANERDVWLVYYRKPSGKPRVAYNDAVEEALCFGWIDSIVKKLDAERFAQRFSPRRPKSEYSQPNKERLHRLIQQNQVMEEVLANLGDVSAAGFRTPPDILKALKANAQAWNNFQSFSAPYQRIRAAFIDSARHRPIEFKNRLEHFLRMTEQNKQFGFGIEAYF